MQVASRWAEPVGSDLTPVIYDGNTTEQQQQQQQQQIIPTNTTTTTSNRSLSLTTANIFPPQRVEPVDMPRPQSSNRNKTGYIRSATTDESATTYMQTIPFKHVKHPTEQSSIVLFLKRFLKICFSLFLSIPFVLFITLILPISWLIRVSTRFLCRYHCTVTPCSCSYLSASDLFWLYNSKNRFNREKIEETTKLNSRTIAPIAAAIFFLDGIVNENSLKKVLINRLITQSSRRSTNNGQKLFPRFSQLLYSHFSGTMWIDYSAFSIDEHIREIPRNILTEEDVQVYVSSLISTELPLNRPLWQLHYKNRSSVRPNDSVIIFLYHPVLSDGISLIRILLKHIVDNRTTQLDLKARFAGRRDEQLFDYIKAYLFGHLLLLKKLIFNSSLDNFLKRILLKNHSQSNIPVQRMVIWSEPFSLTQANRMKLVTRTRMNDLLSTLILSTVKLYLEQHDLANLSNINCIMPCDLRSNTPNIIMGNHLAHLSLEIPMDIEGNIPLLWSFNEYSKQIKKNADYATMYLFIRITYQLFPRCLANKIISRVYNNATLWLTTLAAGSSTTLATMSICNRDVRSLICLNPSMDCNSISFCATSYADEIRLTVIVDPNLIPDPQFFTRCFHQQLNVVQELLAHRRIPGEIRRVTRPPRFPLPKKSISSISDMSDDLSIEEIQTKMTSLQQELLSLKSQFENVDMDDPSSQNQRLIITTKLEELRREFRELLIKLQERQCELSGMIPSDEEDEMDPHVRVRLRSASVASKISLKSNEQRQLSAKMYQIEREDGSEFSATVVHSAAQNSMSSSKMSIAAQPSDPQGAGIRRAQSVSVVENTRVDMPRRVSLSRARPTTPSKNFITNTTIVHLNANENSTGGN